tara:strand:+ start:363 stop:464 length:102 start_codon:yes stop_codon:yes gene_type:complete
VEKVSKYEKNNTIHSAIMDVGVWNRVERSTVAE